MSVRVVIGGESLTTSRRCGKRRVCDGHLAERHHIEVGDPIVWSALPPGSEFGNATWWRHAFCKDCAPLALLNPTEGDH